MQAEMDLEKKIEYHLKVFEELSKEDDHSSPDVHQPSPNVAKLQLPSLILESLPSKDDCSKEASVKNQFIQFNQCALDLEKAELCALNRSVSCLKQKYEAMQKENEGLKKLHNKLNKEHKCKREILQDAAMTIKEVAIPNIKATERNLINVEMRLDKIRSHAPVIFGLYEKITNLYQQASHLQSLASEKEEKLKILATQQADILRKTKECEIEHHKVKKKLQEVKRDERPWMSVTEKDLWMTLDVACETYSKIRENMENLSCETHEDASSPVKEAPQFASPDVEMSSENII